MGDLLLKLVRKYSTMHSTELSTRQSRRQEKKKTSHQILTDAKNLKTTGLPSQCQIMRKTLDGDTAQRH